jgi:hypothetical protein
LSISKDTLLKHKDNANSNSTDADIAVETAKIERKLDLKA